ncbi:MAG: radical SAM protein [candidate division Zixibacteria bacterium]|nr:radical SAM protein [candidate division Zixibacteria bacterium]
MKIIAKIGRDDIATVYIAETEGGKLIEFVDAVQPPLPREKKWVLIVSTLYGCPVHCRFCDAGTNYQGKISAEDIIGQIDFLVKNRFRDGKITADKFKIQFARMGEPSFNPNVLEILDSLTDLYDAPGLMPALSTIGPTGTTGFLKRLIDIKKKHYVGRFQFQFSLHTTDEKLREWLMPVKLMSFEEMADYGKSFFEISDRKIALNFALTERLSIDPEILLQYFNPEIFLIKLTPMNPTHQALKNRISNALPGNGRCKIADLLRSIGYEVIISVGELEENNIGSNCGQYVTAHRLAGEEIKNGYTYNLQTH